MFDVVFCKKWEIKDLDNFSMQNMYFSLFIQTFPCSSIKYTVLMSMSALFGISQLPSHQPIISSGLS